MLAWSCTHALHTPPHTHTHTDADACTTLAASSSCHPHCVLILHKNVNLFLLMNTFARFIHWNAFSIFQGKNSSLFLCFYSYYVPHSSPLVIIKNIIRLKALYWSESHASLYNRSTPMASFLLCSADGSLFSPACWSHFCLESHKLRFDSAPHSCSKPSLTISMSEGQLLYKLSPH